MSSSFLYRSELSSENSFHSNTYFGNIIRSVTMSRNTGLNLPLIFTRLLNPGCVNPSWLCSLCSLALLFSESSSVDLQLSGGRTSWAHFRVINFRAVCFASHYSFRFNGFSALRAGCVSHKVPAPLQGKDSTLASSPYCSPAPRLTLLCHRPSLLFIIRA